MSLNWTLDALEDYSFMLTFNRSTDSVGSSSRALFNVDLSSFELGLHAYFLTPRYQFYASTSDTVMINVTAMPPSGGGPRTTVAKPLFLRDSLFPFLSSRLLAEN